MMVQRLLRNSVNPLAVQSNHVVEVQQILEAYLEGPTGDKGKKLLAAVKQLPRQSKWLVHFYRKLAGSNWFPLVTTSNYVMFPGAETSSSTFADFLGVMQQYKDIKISVRNDSKLIKFLLGCTEIEQRFYLGLLKPESVLMSHLKYSAELRQELSTCTLSTRELFGTHFMDEQERPIIKYPLLFAALPKLLPRAILYKHKLSGKVSAFNMSVYPAGEVSPAHLTWYKYSTRGWNQLKYLRHKDGVVVGYADVNEFKFYAVDFFSSLDEYKKHIRGKTDKVPHALRVQHLREFLDVPHLNQVVVAPHQYCRAEYEIESKMAATMQQTSWDTLVALDVSVHKQFFITTSAVRDGITDGLWIDDDGAIKGVNVWNMGQVIPCGFSFEGPNRMYQSQPKYISLKQAQFNLFQYRDLMVGVIKQIFWTKMPYKTRAYEFADGMKGRLEKCPVCMSTQYPRDSKSICKMCFRWFMRDLKKFGSDVWFRRVPALQKAMEHPEYDPNWINYCNISFRGYQLISNPETGEFKFTSNPVFAENYLKLLTDKRGMSTEEIRLWQKKIRKEQDEDERRDTEAKAICKPAELYEQDLETEAGRAGVVRDGEGDDSANTGRAD